MLLADKSTLWEACSPWARKALFLGPYCAQSASTLGRQEASRKNYQTALHQTFSGILKAETFLWFVFAPTRTTNHTSRLNCEYLQKQDCSSHLRKTMENHSSWMTSSGHYSVVLQLCTPHQEFLYANHSCKIARSIALASWCDVSDVSWFPREIAFSQEMAPRSLAPTKSTPRYHRCPHPLYTSSSSPSASASTLRLPSWGPGSSQVKIYEKKQISQHWPQWFYSCCMLLDPASILDPAGFLLDSLAIVDSVDSQDSMHWSQVKPKV